MKNARDRWCALLALCLASALVAIAEAPKLEKRNTKIADAETGTPRVAAQDPSETAPPEQKQSEQKPATQKPHNNVRRVREGSEAGAPTVQQEAALQLDLLGHGFYFFTNAETERAAVVYRRHDGHIGLIDAT